MVISQPVPQKQAAHAATPQPDKALHARLQGPCAVSADCCDASAGQICTLNMSVPGNADMGSCQVHTASTWVPRAIGQILLDVARQAVAVCQLSHSVQALLGLCDGSWRL